MIETKVEKIGNSLGTVLPKAVLERLNLKEGQKLFLIETPDGYKLSPYDPEFEEQMRLAEEGMADYRNTLRALAK